METFGLVRLGKFSTDVTETEYREAESFECSNYMLLNWIKWTILHTRREASQSHVNPENQYLALFPVSIATPPVILWYKILDCKTLKTTIFGAQKRLQRLCR
ncbi:MAG: hypothetical protein CL912_15075 [Deltaproteobacteria bacterium]|nr:hypothetical protein [Deltaproteobacteria bacterium]